MSFTAKDVASLREATGCGMMDCKKALTEADGDMEKGIEILREKGLAAAAKKSGRIAAEGLVYTLVDEAAKVGVVVEVNSETDFVAKNEAFKEFVAICAKTIIKENPADVDVLLECKAIDSELTIADLLREKILTIGENLKVRRFVRLTGVVSTYIHGGGKIGVAVLFDAADDVASKDEFKALGKDVCMQIAAAYPLFLNRDEVPSDIVEKEKEILLAQIANDPKTQGKPQQVVEKMVEGKIGKYFKDNCLIEQEFVKNNDFSVGKYIESVAKTVGAVSIKSFVRFEKGEGLAKREDNFADEVASMMK